MVFEGDTSSFFTESLSSLTESEWENIHLKKLQFNQSLNFVPVAGTEHLNTIVEDELSKIDKLSEADLEAMVERTLNSQTDSENIAATVTPAVFFNIHNVGRLLQYKT